MGMVLSMAGLQDLPSTFTTGQALRAGVHPRLLYAWRNEGDVVELSRGVFRRADALPASYPDFLAVAFRVPLAVVCLIAAARVHDLTDEIPPAVQIAVPRGGPRPRIHYPPVEVFQFDALTFDLGISSVEAAPAEPIRIYGPERTVVDLLRLRARVGEPTGFIALRRYLARAGARPGEVLELARALDCLGPVRTAIDVLEAS